MRRSWKRLKDLLPGSRYQSLATRLGGAEAHLAEIAGRVDAVVGELSGSLQNKAPFSEVDRLNRAFQHLGELSEEVSQRAPASEIARLNLAFDSLAEAFSGISELNQRLVETSEQLDSLQSERSVEIPWVLASYRGESRVLDVGYVHAEDRWREALLLLEIPMLVGIDLAPPDARRASYTHMVQADVRSPAFADASFDLILAISVIEHIGRDNEKYGLGSGDETAGDHRAIGVLSRYLAPGGRLLLSVPFGRAEDHGWLINYDREMLESLVQSSGLSVRSQRFYEERGGWMPADPSELVRRGYRSLRAPHAGSVALLDLVKPTPDQPSTLAS